MPAESRAPEQGLGQNVFIFWISLMFFDHLGSTSQCFVIHFCNLNQDPFVSNPLMAKIVFFLPSKGTRCTLSRLEEQLNTVVVAKTAAHKWFPGFVLLFLEARLSLNHFHPDSFDSLKFRHFFCWMLLAVQQAWVRKKRRTSLLRFPKSPKKLRYLGPTPVIQPFRRIVGSQQATLSFSPNFSHWS